MPANSPLEAAAHEIHDISSDDETKDDELAANSAALATPAVSDGENDSWWDDMQKTFGASFSAGNEFLPVSPPDATAKATTHLVSPNAAAVEESIEDDALLASLLAELPDPKPDEAADMPFADFALPSDFEFTDGLPVVEGLPEVWRR